MGFDLCIHSVYFMGIKPTSLGKRSERSIFIHLHFLNYFNTNDD